MTDHDHDEVTRRSFQQQVGLFTGPDALFATQRASTVPWVEPLDGDMIVADVACGAAHVAEQLAPHVRQVVGVDLTAELLTLGAARLAKSGVGNVLLQEGNAAELPFVDASFDLVVCRSALHHFPRPDRAVAEMARICRPGGRVVVSDIVAPAARVRDAYDGLHRSIDPSHVAVLLESELADLMQSTVGALTRRETPEPFAIAVDALLTDAADRDAVVAALRSELDGGAPTGFHPTVDGDQVRVEFTSTTVHAKRHAG